MKRLATLTSVIAATVFAVGLMAQGKPNFTGKWTQTDPDPAAAAAGGRGMMGGGGWGTNPTITQDGTTLTVEYQSGGQNPTPQKFVVKTDGSESKNSVSRGGQTTEQVSKAMWDGNKLVIKTQVNFGGTAAEITRVVTLEGGNLVIATTFPNPQGGDPIASKTTYKKS